MQVSVQDLVFANMQDFVKERPSIDAETVSVARKRKLLKHTLRLMAASVQVFVTRHDAVNVSRLINNSNRNDPLSQALNNLTKIFDKCAQNSIDVGSSVKELDTLQRDTRGGVNFVVFLAWKVQNQQRPELVGVATCCKFVKSDRISTLPANLKDDYDAVSKYFDHYYYIDTLCSSLKGVGQLLTLHAFGEALQIGKRGLIALAFAGGDNKRPQSVPMFKRLSFKNIFSDDKNGTLSIAGKKYYGQWLVKDASDFSGIDLNILTLCSRTGLTKKTEKTLMWRCS